MDVPKRPHLTDFHAKNVEIDKFLHLTELSVILLLAQHQIQFSETDRTATGAQLAQPAGYQINIY